MIGTSMPGKRYQPCNASYCGEVDAFLTQFQFAQLGTSIMLERDILLFHHLDIKKIGRLPNGISWHV